MKSFFIRLFVCAVLALLASGPAWAQDTALTGTVTDATSAVVPGSEVTITNQATGAVRTVTTGEDGKYIFPQLSPGKYRIEIKSTGFKTAQKSDIAIEVGITTRFDVTLTVGAVAETVVVEAETSRINTTDATVGNVVSGRQIGNLPSLNLDPAGLLSLQPGVTYVPGAADVAGGYSGTMDFDGRGGSVNGSRSDQTNITLDGVDVNDGENGFAFTSVLRATQASLQEFRVVTSNSNSDAGRSSAAQVQLVTKSGTNDIHGDAYYAHRNEIFNANDFFLNAAGQDRGKFRRHIYGAALGGPIVKDRFFLFGNWEELRENITDSTLRDIPSSSFRDGVVIYECAGGTAACPGGSVMGISGTHTVPAGFRGLTPAEITALDPEGIGPNAAVLAHWAGFPTPNTTGNFDGINIAGFQFSSPVDNFFRTWILRADYNIDASSNHTIFWRGTLQDDDFTAAAPQFPGLPANQTKVNGNRGFSLGYRAVLSPTLVNNFRYGLSRISEQTAGQQTGEFVDFRFIDNLQDFDSSTLGRVLPVHHIGNDLSWTKGNHTLSFGGDARFLRNGRFSNANSFHTFLINPSWLPDGGRSVQPGQAQCSQPICGTLPAVALSFGSSFRDAMPNLLGAISQIDAFYNFDKTGATQPQGEAVQRRFAVNEVEFYVQDQWRWTQAFTFTYGLRYLMATPPWETNGNQVVPTPSLGSWFETRRQLMLNGLPTNQAGLIELDLGGKANNRRGYYAMDYNNLSPRIAAAWAPRFNDGLLGWMFGDGKMVIRGGYSLVYDRIGSALASTFDNSGSFGLSTNITSFFGGCNIGGSNPCARFTDVFDTAAAAAQSLQPSPGASFPATPPSGLLTVTTGLDDRITTPYSHTMSLSIGRELPAGFSFEAAYVGRRGRNLLFIRDYSMPADLVDPGSGVSAFEAARNLIGFAEQNANAPFQGLQTIGSIPFWENLFPSFGPTGVNGGCLQFNIFGLTTNADGSAIPNGQCVSDPADPGLPAGYSATQVAYDYMLGYHGTASTGSGFGTSTFWQDVDYFGFPGFLNCATGSDVDGDGFGDCPNAFFPEQFVNLHTWASIARSEYHAFQFTMRKRMAAGIEFTANYTLAKSLDHSSTPERAPISSGFFAGGYSGSAINSWDIEKEYAVSDFDMRHQFNANWVAEFPFGRGRAFGADMPGWLDQTIGGWQISGIIRMNSGLPAGVINGRTWPTNWNLQGNATCAPVGAYPFGLAQGPCPKTANVKSPDGTRLPNIFADPDAARAQFRFTDTGNRGLRNNLRADKYLSLDLGLAKSFRIVEGHSLTLRWDVFNVTNSTYFDATTLNLDIETQATFGDYLGVMGGPRRMQIGLRYTF